MIIAGTRKPSSRITLNDAYAKGHAVTICRFGWNINNIKWLLVNIVVPSRETIETNPPGDQSVLIHTRAWRYFGPSRGGLLYALVINNSWTSLGHF